MSKTITIEDYKRMTDEQLDELNLSDEELLELLEEALRDGSITAMERIRLQFPALKEAWEQIQVIRELTEKHDPDDNRPKWEKAYANILEGVDGKNPAVREAWDRYYMLKNLILGADKHGE